MIEDGKISKEALDKVINIVDLNTNM